LWCKCVEEKTPLAGKRGIINFSSSAAVEMERILLGPCSAAYRRNLLSREQKRRDGYVLALLDIEPPASNDDTNEARASRVQHCRRHGVPINQIWPAEGDRLFQCALTATDCHLPAPMASNTYRIIWTRAHQGSPTYTVLSG
jgi:hypothetical protein